MDKREAQFVIEQEVMAVATMQQCLYLGLTTGHPHNASCNCSLYRLINHLFKLLPSLSTELHFGPQPPGLIEVCNRQRLSFVPSMKTVMVLKNVCQWTACGSGFGYKLVIWPQFVWPPNVGQLLELKMR